MNSLKIAIEGMHRSGKGTQLDIFRNKLDEINLQSEIIRGAGCRSGKGSQNLSYYDPYSEYWREFSRNRINGSEDWSLAFTTINEEVSIFSETLPVDILLMDRCYLSNEFFSDKFIGMSVDNSFIPDVVYYLRVSKEILISRMNGCEDWKSRFRRKNILEYYDEYDEYMNSSSSVDIVEIDGAKEENEVFEIIFEDFKRRFDNLVI